MKKIKFFFLFAVLIIGCDSGENSSIEQLSQTVSLLKASPTFEYTLHFDIQQNGMRIVDTTKVFIERTNDQGQLPLKYAFESNRGEMQFFDGQTFYTLIPSERTIIEMSEAPADQIENNQVLLFSPFYVQVYLEHLLQHNEDAIKAVGDTVIGGRQAVQYQTTADYIYLLNNRIVKNGEMLPNQRPAENIKKTHLITVDAETLMPLSIKEVQEDGNYFAATFANMQTSDRSYNERAQILDNSGYLPLNVADYMKIQMAKQQQIVGTQASEFTLPLFPESEVSLAELKNAPVLLEFWFPGCGFCIDAVPEVNNILETYKSKGLKVYGVEISNVPQEVVAKYIEQNDVKFPVLMNGKATSLAYGVNGGPTMVLLDKNHKVVYLGKLDRVALDAELNKVL